MPRKPYFAPPFRGFWCKECLFGIESTVHFSPGDNMYNSEAAGNPFKWKKFSRDIILWAVRGYCQFALSYRDLVMMMEERGFSVSHTTIMRWVHEYAVEIRGRVKKFLKRSNDSYRIDETYVKVKGKWQYLYRAINSEGKTLDWMLSETRNEKAVIDFFRQVFSTHHSSPPRVIGVDKHAPYPSAFQAIKNEGLVPGACKLHPVKYLNNIIEQDHRFSKKRVRYSQWFQTSKTASATISGYESIHMIRKGQVEGVPSKDILATSYQAF